MIGPSSFDVGGFRRALGNYATGVTVVTTRTPDGGPTGVTVNSFTSVSLEPPLVSFCLSNRSTLLSAFATADHFAVNVLARHQQALADRFAKPSRNDWLGIDYRLGAHDCALLAGAMATFECVRHAAYPAGDHVILVGEVRAFEVAPTCEPLTFYRGKYGTIAAPRNDSEPSAAASSSTEFVSYWG
jgi:flavin reductase (DIM6/NTAB) family NADH-FMN oxidoreductase RutF